MDIDLTIVVTPVNLEVNVEPQETTVTVTPNVTVNTVLIEPQEVVVNPAPIPVPIETIIINEGIPGPPGPSGGGDPLFSAVASVNIVTGNPVYVKSNGQLGLSEADIYSTCNVVGLAASNTNVGFVCPVNVRDLVLPDWTAVIGTQYLTLNQTYFLSTTPGQLTPIAPSTPGQVVLSVGKAVTADTLEISIGTPILL